MTKRKINLEPHAHNFIFDTFEIFTQNTCVSINRF